MRNQARKSPAVESRGLNNKKADAEWLMKNPPHPFVPSRVPPLLARSMATLTASDLSSLTSGFDSAADGDVVEVSADITLTAQMCVLLLCRGHPSSLCSSPMCLLLYISFLNVCSLQTLFTHPIPVSLMNPSSLKSTSTTTSVTVKSNSAGRFMLTGGGASSSDFTMFSLQGNLEAKFMDLDIVDGYSFNSGGAFSVSDPAQLTLLNVSLTGHFSGGGGGAIYYNSYHPSGLIVTNCVFTECTTSASGGGAIHSGYYIREFLVRNLQYKFRDIISSYLSDNYLLFQHLSPSRTASFFAVREHPQRRTVEQFCSLEMRLLYMTLISKPARAARAEVPSTMDCTDRTSVRPPLSTPSSLKMNRFSVALWHSSARARTCTSSRGQLSRETLPLSCPQLSPVAWVQTCT